MICFGKRSVMKSNLTLSLKHSFNDLQKQIYSFIKLKPKN